MQTGARIEYSPVGSAKGVDGLLSSFLDFACSDACLTDPQMHEFNSNVVHVPLAIGAVVPTYNLTDESGQHVTIRFTGAALANIYLGKIKKWNDPAITVSNLGQTLPDLEITVVHRQDGSGTTAIWTDYLSRSSSAWKDQVGSGTTVQWPIGVEAEKNDGVADAVSRTQGAIGYVELNFALANGLSIGHVKNKFGTFVQPTIDSITSAANASVRDLPDDLRFSLIDASGANSYPIVGTCWAILRVNQANERESEVVRFLRWCTTEGQNHVSNLQYGRLPLEISMKVTQLLDRMSGKP
jgi:phosphate transport system substrate-binding protein